MVLMKKYTFPGEKAYKFHLSQPWQMLAGTVVYWRVKFKWNLNMEVFDRLKVAVFSGGDVKTHKETRAIHEIQFSNGDKLKALF